VEVKTPREFLEKTLPAKFKPENARDFEAVAQVNITGKNGGHWIITIKNQKLETKEGEAMSPALTLQMVDTDFVDLVNGKLNAVNAFMTGKLQFNGSIATGLKLLEMGFI